MTPTNNDPFAPQATHAARHERIKELRAVIPDLTARLISYPGGDPRLTLAAGVLMQATEEYAALMREHDAETKRRLEFLNAGGRPAGYPAGEGAGDTSPAAREKEETPDE